MKKCLRDKVFAWNSDCGIRCLNDKVVAGWDFYMKKCLRDKSFAWKSDWMNKCLRDNVLVWKSVCGIKFLKPILKDSTILYSINLLCCPRFTLKCQFFVLPTLCFKVYVGCMPVFLQQLSPQIACEQTCTQVIMCLGVTVASWQATRVQFGQKFVWLACVRSWINLVQPITCLPTRGEISDVSACVPVTINSFYLLPETFKPHVFMQKLHPANIFSLDSLSRKQFFIKKPYPAKEWGK